MRRVAVFAEDDALVLPATEAATFTIVPVDIADAEATVEATVGAGDFDAFANLCTPALAPRVAAALEPLDVPTAGCGPEVLRYTRSDLYMIAFYADLDVPPHRVVSRGTTAPFDGLVGKLQLRSLPVDRPTTAAIDAGASDALSAALKAAPRLVLESVAEPTAVVKVLVSCGAAPRSMATGELAEGQLKAAEEVAAAMGKATLRGRGHMSVEVHAIEGPKLRIVDAAPNCDVAPFFDGCGAEAAAWTSAVVRDAVPATFRVAFDPKAKGYHVVAAGPLAKGSVVFEDEQHPFPVVTKSHVDKHWTEADRDVFKRYAWPLDSDGHVYAVWEDNPRTWRPINHSCDPNCIFAPGHSLNVIASRDIAPGEDLTMDYATFCDFTMQPFECFCKAACCRTTIVPDAESLAKYGDNAWHRRMRTAQ